MKALAESTKTTHSKDDSSTHGKEDSHTTSRDDSHDHSKDSKAEGPSLPAACTPYPNDIKSVVECCEVPVLFDDNLVGTCEFFCSEDKKNGDKPDCPIDCLFNNNGLMRRKQINRTALEVTYDRFGLANPDWRNITHAALDVCPLSHNDSSKSFQDAYNAFEKCMNNYFRSHCIEYKETVECDNVEEFMDKCQNIHPDCTVWPKWIVKLPEFCCDHRPDLFTKQQQDESFDWCGDQDIISNLGKMQCYAGFMLNATGIKVDGKWNFQTAKKLLEDNSGNDEKWKTAIEKTMETCEKEVHGEIWRVAFN